MQTIVICGKIGRDAETRQAGDNTVTDFSVAVDQGYGDRKTTNWFKVSYWGKRGSSVAPYLLKGGVVTVSGELETFTYQDKLQLGIRANEVVLPQKPRDDSQSRNNGGSSRRQEPQRGGFSDDDFGDTPF